MDETTILYEVSREKIGQSTCHYRGFSSLHDWSTAWGDEIDGCTTFVTRTSELLNETQWSVSQHPCHGDEKGYRDRPISFKTETDQMIAEAEKNLEDSDLDEVSKAEVRAIWESYGWY